MLLCIGAPTVLRFVLDRWLGDAAWFTTYYPFVLLATWVAGWEIGILITLVSALIGNFVFMHPRFQPSLHEQAVAGTLAFVAAAGGIVLMIGLLRPIGRSTQRPRAAARGGERIDLTPETTVSPERAFDRPHSATVFTLADRRAGLLEDAQRILERWRRLAEADPALARRIAPQVSPVLAESLANALSVTATLNAQDEALLDELNDWLLPLP